MKKLDELLAQEADVCDENHTHMHSTALTASQKRFVMHASKMLGKRKAAAAIRRGMLKELGSELDNQQVMEDSDEQYLCPR